jgi:hypothetical protein
MIEMRTDPANYLTDRPCDFVTGTLAGIALDSRLAEAARDKVVDSSSELSLPASRTFMTSSSSFLNRRHRD